MQFLVNEKRIKIENPGRNRGSPKRLNHLQKKEKEYFNLEVKQLPCRLQNC